MVFWAARKQSCFSLHFRWVFLGVVVLAFFVLKQECIAADARLLFIGNSYTFGNDLDQLEKEVLQSRGVWKDVFVQRVAPGGYRWEQHAKDADGSNGNTSLRDFLVTSQDPQFKWNYVILQEQSQIPGFAQRDKYWQASLAALKTLHKMIRQKGAKTILLMTWGRRKGDSMNRARFPDFKTMQKHLAAGYRAFAAQVGSKEAPVLVAPVGLAFEKIYDDIVLASKDPLAPDSLFSKLYSADDSHPSLYGSYLAACVLFATITGENPELLSWSPSTIPTSARKALLRAARAVAWKQPTGEVPSSKEHLPDEQILSPKSETSSEAQADAGSTEGQKEEYHEESTREVRQQKEDSAASKGDSSEPANQNGCSSGKETIPLESFFLMLFFLVWKRFSKETL